MSLEGTLLKMNMTPLASQQSHHHLHDPHTAVIWILVGDLSPRAAPLIIAKTKIPDKNLTKYETANKSQNNIGVI